MSSLPGDPSLLAGFGALAARFSTWSVVAQPDRDEAEWWVGAPSVCRDDAGDFWLAARMRTGEDRLGRRGYEIRIYRSEDGLAYEPVHSIRRADVPIAGFERPALVRDPETGRFRLYACGPIDDIWCIVRFDDAVSPDRFAPSSCRTVLRPPTADPIGPATPTGYKDPVVLYSEGVWHCYVIGIQGNERLFHFAGRDDSEWRPVGGQHVSLLPLAGWHDHAVRPASLLPIGAGWLLVYEGSSVTWLDPSYNIATGLAYSPDLSCAVDLTPDRPLLASPTPGRLSAWRYSHWMWVGLELWVWAEVEKSNGAHEIRLFRLPRI